MKTLKAVLGLVLLTFVSFNIFAKSNDLTSNSKNVTLINHSDVVYYTVEDEGEADEEGAEN